MHDQQQPLIPEVSPQMAAEMLGVSRKTIYRMIHQGVLVARRLTATGRRGLHYRIPQDEVVAIRHDYRAGHPEAGPAMRTRGQADSRVELELIRLRG